MTPAVLFVDDEALMLRSLQRAFSADYDVTVAYSADEARSLLSSQSRFDVVVCDIGMPETDGLTFIEEIAAEHPRAQFVVLTGACDAETLERARRIVGEARVLSKPASREKILGLINDLTARPV